MSKYACLDYGDIWHMLPMNGKNIKQDKKTGDTMNIGKAFPSKYLKASDIDEGQQIKVIIDHVKMEAIGSDESEQKPVCYFVGKEKGVVLNKTSADMLSAQYGQDTDDWKDKDAVIYTVETSFQGKACMGLRVKPVKSATIPKAQAKMPDLTRDLASGDDIPF
jgi:hypothetical protein